jgi:hypothetical protein
MHDYFEDFVELSGQTAFSAGTAAAKKTLVSYIGEVFCVFGDDCVECAI